MYYFVLNSNSGSYSHQLEEKIKAAATKILAQPFKVIYTKKSDELFLPDLPHGLQTGDTLIAVGGDGTLNNCLNYLYLNKLTEQVNLAIIPRGTGNNMLKALNLSKNITKCLHIIKNGKTERLQFGTINGRQTFFNCSIGFSAYILTQRRFKSRNGYVLDILLNLLKYKADQSSVLANGESKAKHYFYGFFINTTHYASILPFLKSNSTDGKIRFFHLGKLSLIKNLLRFARFIIVDKGLKVIESDRFEFQPGPNALLEIDGDVVLPAEKYIIEYAGRVNVIRN